MNPTILDVNQANFEAEVIQQSHQRPVVVDFWAP
jgi:thioredoxin-like negative regulator of GroEL